jgi:predicted metal-binding protein
MDRLKPFTEKALEAGVDNVLAIRPSAVVTAPWVPMKCQFGCGGYGRSLCCPPFTPTPEKTREILDSYSMAILLHQHWTKGYGVVNHFNETLVELERLVFLAGFYKAWALGSGPCLRCRDCDTTMPCAHPEKARPSMEACGIDVFKTARDHHLSIRVVTDHEAERDIFGLILVE